MANSRKHAQKMKLNGALEKIAEKGNMVVSGANGQQILNFFNKTIEDVSKDISK
jgi:hypothetical protein